MNLVRCLFLIGLLGLTACASKPPKDAVALGIHLIASGGMSPARQVNVVLRTPSLSLQVDRMAALTERDLDTAEIVGEGDNFRMRFVFDTHGTIVLDTISVNNRGELVVIFLNNIPVAAPMLRQHIVDGVLEFTPDLTRSEAERAVHGLKLAVDYIKKRS